MGWDFIDPADFFMFSQQGQFMAELTNTILAEELKKHEYAVIPGFLRRYAGRPGKDVFARRLRHHGRSSCAR